MSFYTADEIQSLGFARVGSEVRISRRAAIYNPGKIWIGGNVRIDDFCVLSAGDGGIEIGDFVHVAVYCSLIGAGRITLKDFSGLSSRVSVYSSNDDYSGAHLTNPTVPPRFKGVRHADVLIGRHAIVGAGTVILPGVSLGDGAAVGALSLVTKSCESFEIYSGIPAKRIGSRGQGVLDLEQQLLAERTALLAAAR